MTRLRVLIADENGRDMSLITQWLFPEPAVEIVRISRDAAVTSEAIDDVAPHLVFLDPSMPGVGLAMGSTTGDRRGPLVVFVTSCGADGRRAFEIGAFDYLVRPFSRRRVQIVLERAREHLRLRREADASARLTAALEQFRAAQPSPQTLLVRVGDRLRVVSSGDVQWLEAHGNYVRLHLPGESLALREPLSSLIRRLGDTFVRVHRRFAVRRPLLRELEIAGPADYRVVLDNGIRLRVGRRYRSGLEAALRGGAGPGSDRLDATSATWIVPSQEL